MVQCGKTPEERLRSGYLLCLSRPPGPEEQKRLLDLQATARAYPDLGFSATAEKWQGYVDERGLECPAR